MSLIAILIILIIGVALFLPVLMSAFRIRKPRTAKADTVGVALAETEFIVEDRASRTSMAIPWASLQRITVIKTQQGPFADDLFYHIVYAQGEVTLPAKAQNMDALASHMMTLSGFDQAAYKKALGSTESNRFVVCFQTQARSGV